MIPPSWTDSGWADHRLSPGQSTGYRIADTCGCTRAVQSSPTRARAISHWEGAGSICSLLCLSQQIDGNRALIVHASPLVASPMWCRFACLYSKRRISLSSFALHL